MKKWFLALLAFVFMAFPVAAEDPVSRVEARIAELRTERAVRYAEIRAASEARIQAMLAEIEAERASWYVERVATPTPMPVPHYVAPVIVSPGPNDTYGSQTEWTVDIRSRYPIEPTRVPVKNPTGSDVYDKPTAQYKWWGETVSTPRGGEVFQWTWDGTLLADEYFQVQLICPNGSHRGIHPPTKELYTVQGGGLRYIVQDCKGAQTRAWDHESWTPTRNIDIEWTVAIVQWDGVDPSKIGATLAEAEARWLRI